MSNKVLWLIGLGWLIILIILGFAFYSQALDVEYLPPKVTVKYLTSDKPKDLYEDIRNQYRFYVSPNPKWYGDRATTAHELTHLLDANIRNANVTKTHQTDWFFYIGNQEAVKLPQSKITKVQFMSLLNKELIGFYYDTYVNSANWNNDMMFCIDEWMAYTNDLNVSMQDMSNKLNDKWKDLSQVTEAQAMIEFTVYGTAFMMAMQKYDLDNFKNKDWQRFFG